MKLFHVAVISWYAIVLLMSPVSSFIRHGPAKVTHRKLHANKRGGVGLASLLYEEGMVPIERGGASFELYYRVYNGNATRAPIVMCHGGPSLPSQYLYPIISQVYDHPIIFFDQLGCGKSDEPKELSYYSIPKFVQDLEKIISLVVAPNYSSFHLFGHSFGGILAFEYLRSYLEHNNPQPKCQSVILSNAPADLQQCNQDYDRLYARNPLTFWKQYACSIGIPPSLDDAMKHAESVWMGMDAVMDYKAEALRNADKTSKEPQLLVISCTRDFAYSTSNEEAWTQLLPPTYLKHTRFVNFEDCRHYPFYEDEIEYGRTLRSFLGQVEGET